MAETMANGGGYFRDYDAMSPQEQQLMKMLKKEREEASKREEALRDRLILQESLANKQIIQLKSQMKRSQVDSGKPQKNRDLSGTPVSVKGEHKRESKSRDVRELQKIIAGLKVENESLEQKLQKLTDFVKIASDIKTKAISQIASKDEEIENLQSELRALENVYSEEVQRRVKIESEVRSLRIYVDHVGHKSREKMVSRSAQTEMSVPPKFMLDKKRMSSSAQWSPSNTASFAQLNAAAASWRVKSLENEHHSETRRQKEKFDGVVSIPASSSYPNRRAKKVPPPNSRRQNFSSSSASEAEKHPVLYPKSTRANGPLTRPVHSATNVRKHNNVKKTFSDESAVTKSHHIAIKYWNP